MMNFEKQGGLIPVVVQDAKTLIVLMVGFMNEEAYKKTIQEKVVTFFSRTKQRLWTKGETSGNFLNVIEILEDCDEDTILIKANPIGHTCHTGSDTCFAEENKVKYGFLTELENLLKSRKENKDKKSYTSQLFNKGTDKIAQKVGEEAVELVIEAMKNDENLFKEEAADLLFHYLILLQHKNYSLQDIVEVLILRHQKSN